LRAQFVGSVLRFFRDLLGYVGSSLGVGCLLSSRGGRRHEVISDHYHIGTTDAVGCLLFGLPDLHYRCFRHFPQSLSLELQVKLLGQGSFGLDP